MKNISKNKLKITKNKLVDFTFGRFNSLTVIILANSKMLGAIY